MHDFTPFRALAGGAFIGLAASLLLIANGKVAGVSGILGGVLKPVRGDLAWRAWFLGALLATGALAGLIAPSAIEPSPRSLAMLAAAGALVGIGTRLGNGCTSGHGVCGISRLSGRSIVATLTFIATGIATTTLLRMVAGTS